MGYQSENLNDKNLAKFRNEHIGFIFQFHQLLPEFTALENVCIPAYINNVPKEQAEHRAIELLTHLGLPQDYNTNLVNSLGVSNSVLR